MKIMVFDVPASTGGALAILKQYYDESINDISNEWIFVISTPKFSDTANVRILNFPWIKKSWFHRLFFDHFTVCKLLREHKPDEILSLQNIVISHTDIPQTLYLHQSLPFVEKRYTLIENSMFWIYQNIISQMIYTSLRKASKIIVQTNWMKEVCIKKGISGDKIIVHSPVIADKITGAYVRDTSEPCLFIYPAAANLYKNHEIILRAAILLKEKNINSYKIIFTLTGTENKLSHKLLQETEKYNVNIEFVGNLSKEILFSYYRKAILLFPSYIETFGLPMLEARMHNAPVIASDCAFSHEILDGYDKANFFKYNDEKELYKIMEKHIKESVK